MKSPPWRFRTVGSDTKSVVFGSLLQLPALTVCNAKAMAGSKVKNLTRMVESMETG